jgi:hypothetical protein
MAVSFRSPFRKRIDCPITSNAGPHPSFLSRIPASVTEATYLPLNLYSRELGSKPD